MNPSRIVVVGGGILGAAVAYELAARGERSVVVIEAEPALNRHSTGRSAAYYIPMYESLAYASLAKASLPFLQSPPVGFSVRPIFSQDGALIAAIEGRGADITKEMHQAKSLGIEVQSADAAMIRELVPVAKPERIEAAAFYPEAGEIDVSALADAYAEGARCHGIAFRLDERFLGTAIAGGKIVAVRTSKGEIPCEIVVNAAGAWAAEVAVNAGAEGRPVLMLRRHLLRMRLPEHWSKANWPFFRCPSLPLYFKPRDGWLSFSPMDADKDVPQDCQIAPQRIAQAIKALSDYSTLEVDPAAVIAIAGHRVFAADHGPLVGEDPTRPGLFWAAAMGGSGIMAAPAVGELVASEILGIPTQIDRAPVGLTRFALSAE